MTYFKAELDRLWKAKAGEIKALEERYIFWAHSADVSSLLSINL
jgi:hypothetical protein